MKSTVSSRPPSTRGEAARIIAGWLRTGRFPDRDVDGVKSGHSMVLELVQGVVRWRRYLEEARAICVARKPNPEVDALLLVGLYQVLRMEKMPGHAAVHETVEAAKGFGGRKTADFVNAVLRRATAQREAIDRAIDQKPWQIRLSHPDLLVRRWVRAYEDEGAHELCEWNNLTPDVVVRVIKSRISTVDYLGALESAGVHALTHAARPDECIVLPHGVRIATLPGYQEGWFTVQDPSTITAPELLDPQPGETILDACAAPGGKTSVLAEKMRGSGLVIACDVHEDRLAPLRDNVRRLRLENVLVARCDAADPDALLRLGKEHGAFDRILLDVPCTNTGVIRRRPDVRWRFSGVRIQKATATQRALLKSACTVLKPGGALVYSTCSLEPEENEGQMREWLAAHKNFMLEREVKLFPPVSGTDGAYAALLRKKTGG